MRAVRSQGTKLESVLGRLVKQLGIPFRTQVRELPGSPDIVLNRASVAIFVHGCFWHGHARCRRATLPKTHRRFWSLKIASNRRRDAAAARRLRRSGFSVLTIWGCQLKDQERIEHRIRAALRKTG